MPRQRISTTVDQDLLARARRVTGGVNDAKLMDQALAALLDTRRRTEIDGAYAAYDDRPIDEPDEWGDLSMFREAAGSA